MLMGTQGKGRQRPRGSVNASCLDSNSVEFLIHYPNFLTQHHIAEIIYHLEMCLFLYVT